MGQDARLLLIEDDSRLQAIVAEELGEHGFEVSIATDGNRGLEFAHRGDIDLVVLDLGLPGIGGLDILRRIRTSSELPVIVLTGRGSEADRVVGLELGADDYVVKPFSSRELVARIRSVLRRTIADRDRRRLDYGALVIDQGSREVRLRDEPVALTAREFDLLVFLACSPHQVFSRDQLLTHVWQSAPAWQDPRTVTEHVYRIRRKLADEEHDWIRTRRNAGYLFAPRDQASMPSAPLTAPRSASAVKGL